MDPFWSKRRAKKDPWIFRSNHNHIDMSLYSDFVMIGRSMDPFSTRVAPKKDPWIFRSLEKLSIYVSYPYFWHMMPP